MKWNLVVIVMTSILFLMVSCNTTTQPQVVNYSNYTAEDEVVNAYFNRPFITIDETLQLYAGMSPSSVQSVCGDPLYIALGCAERTVWIYEVRELWVGEGVGNYQLVKFGNSTKIMTQMHYMGLAFEYGTLVSWAPVSHNQLFDSLIFGEYLEVDLQQPEDEGL